ncbi:beta strand repeat-containing protein, partial [Budvicia diplopodorum]|uniref:beta strand repeat-containing protein n=1 Tax=Budvicia diplopodorum TaxID=1119056 RepID=UPI00135C2314
MKKKALSLCIALTLTNNVMADTNIENKKEQPACPTNISTLTKEQREELPATCLAEEDELWTWLAGGLVAGVAAITAIVINNDDGGSLQAISGGSHGGGDGGNGNNSNNGGNSGNGGGDNAPLSPAIFSNGVTFDPNARTVTFNNTTYQYVQDGNKYTLTAPDGTVLYTDRAQLSVDIRKNLLIKGQDANGLYWSYDAAGKFIRATVNTRVIEGDGSNNTIDTGTSASGKNIAGTIVDGDNTSTVINGGANATDGGTAIKVDGNSAVVDNTGGMNISGGGSSGTNITGDNGKVINGGAIDITNGGTGTQIDGNSAQVNNTGDSNISGNGSTGTDINGNGAIINNTGNTTVTGGGTGTKIDGNNAKVDNKGDTAATGAGTAGLVVKGDDARVDSFGDISVSDGAIGTEISGNNATVNITGSDGTPAKVDVNGGGKGVVITGDNANLVIDNVLSTVDGKDSALVDISGADAGARVRLNGDIYVKNSAKGLDIKGSNARVDTVAQLFVEDLNSLGINISGASATFTNTGDIHVSNNAIGTIITSDNAVVTLDGSVNVKAVKGAQSVLQNGDGVVVNGSHNRVAIVGSVVVGHEALGSPVTAKADGMSGVLVNGNDNNVVVDGSIALSLSGSVITSSKAYHDENAAWSGVNVTGSGNNVALNGGVNVSYVDLTSNIANDAGQIMARGIAVSGNNRVEVHGESSLTSTAYYAELSEFAQVTGGGQLYLAQDSLLNLNFTIAGANSGQNLGIIDTRGANTVAENAGSIRYLGGRMNILSGASGASITNSGSVSVLNNQDNMGGRGGVMLADARYNTGSTAVNSGAINIVSTVPGRDTDYFNYFLPTPYSTAYYGELAINKALATNIGTITMAGAGLYGMGSGTGGTTINSSDISVNGFIATTDNSGVINGQTAYSVSDTTAYLRGGGMVAGTTHSSFLSYALGSTATNAPDGTITVKNSGFGMLAMGGGTVTNKGTITVGADQGTVSDGTKAQLIGMGAIKGGLAINDTSGKIYINTDVGKAFYNDGTGLIINRGEILVGEGVDESVDNSGNPAVVSDKAIMAVIPAGSGETQALTSATGFLSLRDTANYGNLTLNGDFTALSWLFNDTEAMLNMNGTLVLKRKGLENKGDITATAISTQADVNVYNRAGASLTVNDKLYITGDSTLFNEGTFTGTVNENSYLAEVVNTGSMRVARDGAAAIESSAVVYNQAGGSITNTGNAVEGGANTLINSTRTGPINFFANSGTLSAKNGYSAVKTVDVSATDASKPVWLYNNATGVIEGINPTAPLINLTRGYHFYNDGTITVQGNNAVAISGGITGYAANLVNSGTINVGTEVGKTNGTNGTNLVGIKGNGVNTTINNAADGVINIYADSSYAFGGT